MAGGSTSGKRKWRGRSRRACSSGDGTNSSDAEALFAARQALPIWRCRKALVTKLAKHATLILTGETGCGKTTQIPQFLHAAGYTAQVICTHACAVVWHSVSTVIAEERHYV